MMYQISSLVALSIITQSLAFAPVSTQKVSLIQSLRASEVTDWDKLQPKLDRKNDKTNKPQQRDDPEWKFFDTARINVSGGDGGNGCVAFRREKGVAMGGPSGGRGGNGGSVILICDEGLNTLAPSRNRVHVRARKGNNGIGKGKNGCAGIDEVIPVPPGTVVRELHTQKVAGELKEDGETLLVARGGRGGRGNEAFKTQRYTAPKIAERGEPGASRWLSLELKLVADVGFLGKPNAGKSTLLAAASAARPKIANYPFTTIVPNLGVCDIGDEGAGLVLCDIPGLIEGASSGVGLGITFLRHVQRCRVLLHVVDGTSDDPIGDFVTINEELRKYDDFLAEKPQVVVLNKIDVTEVKEKQDELLMKLREAAGHSRVLPISAATRERVQELMGRLKKFADMQPVADLPEPPQVDFTKAELDDDSDDFGEFEISDCNVQKYHIQFEIGKQISHLLIFTSFELHYITLFEQPTEIISDPAYPGQWRVNGNYIEQVAKMTHWEYPEAVERFGRQLDALGIAAELQRRGAVDGDLVMVDKFDFDFAPGMTNAYIPYELLEKDKMYAEQELTGGMLVDEPEAWRPFKSGGYLDDDSDELVGFGEFDDWDMLDEAEIEEFKYEEDDDVWQA